MDSISSIPKYEKILKEDRCIDLEESFYFDQESLKTVWDQSEKSINMINQITENLSRQETDMKKRIEMLYLNAMNVQVNLMTEIFQTEIKHLMKLKENLQSAKSQVENIPDLPIEQWNYLDPNKIKELQKLEVRLTADAKGDSTSMQKGLVNFTCSSANEQMAQISRNPKYPTYTLRVASDGENKSSTPIEDDSLKESQPTIVEKNEEQEPKIIISSNEVKEETKPTFKEEKSTEQKITPVDETSLSSNSISSASTFFARFTGKHQYYEIDDEELPSGSWHTAYLGSHGDPSYFFIIPECLKKHTEELNEILNEMDSFYGSVERGLNRKNFKISEPHKGQPCAVMESGKYARGKIIELNSENNLLVKVFLVDEGDVIECSIDNIRLMPKHYLAVHMMAIPCKLTQIQPTTQDGNWSLECTNYFKTMLSSRFTVYIDKRSTVQSGHRNKYSGLPPRKNISSVTLYKEVEKDGKSKKISINHELVKMGYAEIENPEPGCLSEVSYYGNIEEYNFAEVNAKQNPIRTTDRECTILSGYEPNYWYIRLKGYLHNLTFDKGKLQSMLQELNYYYIKKNSVRFKRLETIVEVENEDSDGSEWEALHCNFKPGDFVALKYEEDGIWKRGKVLQVYDHQSKTDVLLIDEGVIVFSIPIENLDAIEEKFMTMVSDVYCVRLADINDINLKSFHLHSNIIEELTKEENLFETEIFVRFEEDPYYENPEILDVSRTLQLDTYPVRMILRAHKGARDPFGHTVLYQKDLSIFLMEKGLATNLYKWEDPSS